MPKDKRWLIVALGGVGVLVATVAFAVLLTGHQSSQGKTVATVASPSAVASSPSGTSAGTATPSTSVPPTSSPAVIVLPTAAVIPTAVPGSSRSIPASDPTGPLDVAKVLFPTGPDGASCGVLDGGGQYGGCPISRELSQRLASPPASLKGVGEPLCRCNNYWQTATYHVVNSPYTNPPATQTVQVDLAFGPTSFESMTIVATNDGVHWLATNTYCGPNGRLNNMLAAAPQGCG